MSRTYVVTDYYASPAIDPRGQHRNYRGVLRDPETDERATALNLSALRDAIAESGAVDGDEIEIIVRKTGRRPFGDRKVRLVKPHTYEREE